MFLTVIILFCLVPFTTVSPAENEAADPYRKGTGPFNLEQKFCGDDADEGLYKALVQTDEQPNEPAPQAEKAVADKEKEATFGDIWH